MKSFVFSYEINEAFVKLIDGLRRLNGDLLSVSVFGSYITEEFKPWISDIDILIVYRETKKKEWLKTEIRKIFKKHSYLDRKMKFHHRLFDPWLYSENEIMKLPLERMLSYSIPFVKRNYKTLFGKDMVQKIPDPIQEEIIESYLSSLVQMFNWLENRKDRLNSPRLDLFMKSIILRSFNALRGYLAVKGTIETNRRKAVEQFSKFVPCLQSESIHQVLDTYENWTMDFPKDQVAEYYEGCLVLLKYLYNEVTGATGGLKICGTS